MVTGDAVEQWLRSIPPDTVVYTEGEGASRNCVVTQYAKTVLPKTTASAPNYTGTEGDAPAYIFTRVYGQDVAISPADSRARRMMTAFDSERYHNENMTAVEALEIIERKGV